MRRIAILVLVLLGIAAGLLVGCLVPDCPDDWVCGPVRNGQYEMTEKGEDDENGYFGEITEGWATVEDGRVTIQYSRPDGSEWRVVYAK